MNTVLIIGAFWVVAPILFFVVRTNRARLDEREFEDAIERRILEMRK